jgi:NhaC family Na+:H+ antiporter
VATFDYAPYALFNLICPILAVIFGYLMIAQPRAEAASA